MEDIMIPISCNEGMSGRLFSWKKIKCSPDRAIIDETKSNETYNFITGISELAHLDYPLDFL
jgi:hypothetical protein